MKYFFYTFLALVFVCISVVGTNAQTTNVNIYKNTFLTESSFSAPAADNNVTICVNFSGTGLNSVKLYDSNDIFIMYLGNSCVSVGLHYSAYKIGSSQ